MSEHSIVLAELQAEVEAISKAALEIRQSGISERALHLLIQHAAPKVHGKYKSQPIPLHIIRGVLDGMEALESFVFDEEEKS